MGGYLGLISLGSTLQLLNQCHSGALVATAPDGTPTYAVYDVDGDALLMGSLGASDHDSKTGLRRGTMDLTAGNGFAAGNVYQIRVAYQISASDIVDIWSVNVV